MSGTCIDLEMQASVRHVWDMHRLQDVSTQCKTMSGTWHWHYTLCLRLIEYPIAFQMVQ
ncbi:hypothetical protein F383_02614 [Gossypium arboreum]|uniref:Uncharacterized protein n=1 Tax=Gossypium arboreum TaxID=29729 RepID=A0A0B0P585_GOSAR|nr:hypothetical protein F383_02614 [Gossypium arboreum]